MRDPCTQLLELITYDGKGGRLVVPMAIMEKVKALFDGLGVRYWLDDTTLSVDGNPPYGFVNLGRQVDANLLQEALDRAE